MDDPAYKPWFLQFKPTGPWYSPKCDPNSGKCSDYYHMYVSTNPPPPPYAPLTRTKQAGANAGFSYR
jgi:hypothetical protein